MNAAAMLLLALAAEDPSWRATPPPLGPPRPLVLPAFQRDQLDNGLVVLVATQPNLPVIGLQITTRGGAALDPAERPGLGSLVYAMLEEGAGDRDALAFSDAVADLGASFGAGGDRDRGTVSVSGLTRHASQLATLLSDAVRRPRLVAADLERKKAQTAASIERQLASPQGLAFLRIPSLVYGEAHPFGHPPTGTPESVRSVTVEEVRAHHPRLISPERSAFIAVGDIDLAGARALAERHFGDWKADNPASFSIPPVKPRPREKIVFLDKPGSPQTMTVFARPIFGRGDRREDALVLANAAFGGSFSSRLNMNLREDKGYTYGAGSQVALRNGVGVFLAYAALRREDSVPGLIEFFREIERIEKDPIGDDELERVKAATVRRLPGQFERISDLGGTAADLFAYELPLDHFTELGPRRAAVPLTAVNEVAQEQLLPNLMQILLVGDAKTVVPALEDQGFGPIQVERP